MSRPHVSYIFARACTRQDEAWFHRAQLVHRLRCIAAGRRIELAAVVLARGQRPNGAAVQVSVVGPRGPVSVGYVLREGWDALELRDALRADLDEPMAHEPGRRAA